MPFIYLPRVLLTPQTARLLGDLEYSDPLLVNQTISKQLAVILPDSASDVKYVFVVTDYQKDIFENGNEANNIAGPTAIQVSLTNWSDLAVNNFSVPDTIKTALNYDLINSVINKGTLDVNGSWIDALYISKSPVWDRSSAILVDTFKHSQVFVAQQSAYSNSKSISVPFTTSIPNGTDSALYYFFLIVDTSNRVFENTGETNNIFRSSPVFVYNPWADHVVPGITGADTAIVGSPYKLKWLVKNTGGLPGLNSYKDWNDGVYLSIDTLLSPDDKPAGTRFHIDPLTHNAQYIDSLSYSAPYGSAGDYYIFVYTDIEKKITGELNKSNNFNLIRDVNGLPKPIHFVELPAADLSVASFIAPLTAIAGQPINIIWSVKNHGAGNANGSWKDDLFLSPDYSTSKTLLSDQSHKTGLKMDSTYADSAQVTIPASAKGNYVLVFKTDAANDIYEAGAENNNYGYSVIAITQLPACDLITRSIIAPDTIVASAEATISWQLKNASVNPALGNTREAVYLSEDTVYDDDDPLVGVVKNDISIQAGDSISHFIKTNINGAFAGYNYVLVRADLSNNINELDETNNIGVSAHPIFIKVKDLPIETSTPDLINNNQFLYYKIDVPDSLIGATLLVSMEADTPKGNTELYVSANRAPSPANYDFGINNPFQQQKQVVIPALDSGVYYLAIRGTDTGSSAHNIRLLAHVLPFAITNVDINHGGNTGNVTVKISGSKFEPGMTAHLLANNAVLDITATNINYINSTLIWATFNLSGQPVGIYDVKLQKANNTNTSLSGGFTVEPGNTGGLYIGGISNTGTNGSPNAPGCDPGAGAGINQNLQFLVNYPGLVRGLTTVPLTITFANQGNVDIPAPSRLLTSEAWLISLTAPLPANSSRDIFLEFMEPGGPPGILRAGASGTIVIYTKAIGSFTNKFSLK